MTTGPLQDSQHASAPPARRVRPFIIVTELLRDAGILPSREAPRHWHWLALTCALIYQCLWCVALIWLTYVRFLIIPLGTDGQGHGDTGAIEVTFIDDTSRPYTPPWPTPLPEPLPEPEPIPDPIPEPRPAPLPEPPTPAAPPEPAPIPAPPSSPLVVTEVDLPDEDAFTLHVPEFQRPEAPPLPEAHAPAAERELTLLDVPLMQRPDDLPPITPDIAAIPPDITTPDVALPERDIPPPLTEPELRPLPSVELAPVEMAAQELQLIERAIPAPLSEPALRPLPAAQLPPVEMTPPEADIAPREIALTPVDPPPSPPTPAVDAAPSPPVPEVELTLSDEFLPAPTPPSDAWDLPAQPAPPTEEAGTGLLDAQGRPQLPGAGTGRPGNGLPPGTLVEDYANIDRMGNWLKRPPPGANYQPSQLDQLWLPHENILEEWVRRSIQNILIPIPGTNKTIRCTVVLLMLGGACGITDPNLLDTDATSRPPPDIPFKPELHEDQDSLGAPNSATPEPLTLPQAQGTQADETL